MPICETPSCESQPIGERLPIPKAHDELLRRCWLCNKWQWADTPAELAKMILI